MKNRIISKPSKRVDLNFDNFYIEISNAWEHRAKELQARRWEKIRQKEKKGYEHDRHSTS